MDIKKLGEFFVGSFTYNANSVAKREQGPASTSQINPPSSNREAVRISSNTQDPSIMAENKARQEKIASLRQQVQSGTYQPDSRKVAAALFAELF